MNSVSTITGYAAPLFLSNIDTDTIIRIERLTQKPRQEWGPYALEALRYRPDGSEDPTFVLNRPPFRDAPILLAGANFGCGSSREGAVWALQARGFQCIIAESFGEIFFNNCFQNGILPIRLNAADMETLGALPHDEQPVTVDLPAQSIRSGTTVLHFDIEANRRQALLDGRDEITRTMTYVSRITAWEQHDRQQRPWIWGSVAILPTPSVDASPD